MKLDGGEKIVYGYGYEILEREKILKMQAKIANKRDRYNSLCKRSGSEIETRIELKMCATEEELG